MFIILELNGPELLRNKVFALLKAVNDETQGRKLAGTIAQDLARVAKAKEDVPEVEGLEASEAGAYSEVYLLSYTHCLCEIPVRLSQILHGPLNVIPR